MTRIAVLVDLTAEQRSALRDAAGAEAELVWDRALAGCDVAFGNPDPAAIEAADDLRWVQLESVGFGEYLGLDPARLERLTFTNLAGFFADPVAETALAGLLALGRGLDRLIPLRERGEWVGDPIRADLRLLRGRRVAMLGRGAIAQRLGELLAPFGCSVTCLGRNAGAAEIDAAVGSADIFVAAVPDTPGTRGLVSGERLARLPEHGIFVNVGRGSVVDEPALVDALQQRRIAGAVLDVTAEEPLTAGHPLWTCPNIILTQHSGGGTADEIDRKIAVFADNLSLYRRGASLRSVVDFARSY